MRFQFDFIGDFLAPQRVVFYFFLTFLSVGGGHLDLGIYLEWPNNYEDTSLTCFIHTYRKVK